ncbi:MAG TPA: hypothetical protein VJQ83_03135 [Tepidiformaceae bacterium]|nr:hypothetical protein [Tepidiformaceae bacterium]
MGKYGSEIPEGDDRPPGARDPLAYEDEFIEQLRSRRASPFGGWSNTGDSPNFELGVEGVLGLAGLAVRGAVLLVTWPVRWAWRRRR